MAAAGATTGCSDESAQVSEFTGDRLHLGRDHGGDQLLEAGDGLWRFNSRLLVLDNVLLVQLVHEARLGIDQVVNFLRFMGKGFIYRKYKDSERDVGRVRFMRWCLKMWVRLTLQAITRHVNFSKWWAHRHLIRFQSKVAKRNIGE